MANKFKSKPGLHGTLYLYAISYVDSADPDNTGTSRIWAYDAEHAVDKFMESDSDGWTIVGTPARIRER